jgi:hypothetical protein
MTENVLFGAGVLIFFASGATFMGVLFANGGVKRSKQFGVLAALWRGDHGSGARRLLTFSLAGLVAGALTLFSGVGVMDAARTKRCQAKCQVAGHPVAKIGPSSEKDPPQSKRAAFVACLCSGGPGQPVEFRADEP